MYRTAIRITAPPPSGHALRHGLRAVTQRAAFVTATSAHRSLTRVVERASRLWEERHDETGLDEAVTKMLWLAAGVAVAVAATTFFVGVFQDAQANVPDPIAPLP